MEGTSLGAYSLCWSLATERAPPPPPPPPVGQCVASDHTDGNGRGGAASPDCANAEGNIPDEFHADLRHSSKGMLSMANAGAGTGSSQFFITFAATSWLDGYDAAGAPKACGTQGVSCHPVFGKVVQGTDVLDNVNAQAGSSSGTPRIPVTLVGATVAWP